MKNNLLLFGALMLAFCSCKKNEPLEHSVLRQLHKKHPTYGITACKLNNQVVYCLSQLYFDGGSTVYNASGTQILTCNYAWSQVDSGCYKLDSCQAIFTPAGNGLNLPPIDVYGLAND